MIYYLFSITALSALLYQIAPVLPLNQALAWTLGAGLFLLVPITIRGK